MRLVLVLMMLFSAELALAYKPDKCFKFVHSGGLRKYDYPGNLSTEYMTKKYGTFAPTENSQQSATASIDPFVWMGRLTSTSQFTTSWGACDYFALKKELKREYIAKNQESIKEEVAMGRGEHLKSIHFYSSCSPAVADAFNNKLQSEYGYIRANEKKSPEALLHSLDLILLSDPTLRGACQVI